MASAQEVRVTTQVTEEKSKVDQAVKKTQASISNDINNGKGNRELVLVTGVIKNQQKRGIMLMKSHDWKGQFIAKLTDNNKTIFGHASGGFVHQGAPTHGNIPIVVGSKGAMIYGHYDGTNLKLGWLLAWYKPDNSNEPNKVYAEAGNLVKLMKMEWAEIEQKLDASRSVSRYSDGETGASAAAEIKDYGDKLALIRASFDHSVAE
ncbi:unnamed protein product [Amaranthus hypochondriacus]